MKSPHEVLLDDNITRLQREEKEERWVKALAACRTPVWPGLMGVIVWPALLVTILALEHTAKIRPPYYFAVLFFMIAVGQLVAACKKRHKAWITLVEEGAPELYEKLKRENLA